MVETVTFINTFFCGIGICMIFRAIYYSYVMGFKAAYRSVSFLLSSDKKTFESMMRVAMFAMLITQGLQMTYLINRITADFPPYLNEWTAFTSMVTFICKATVSFIAMAMYDIKLLDFLTKHFSKPTNQ